MNRICPLPCLPSSIPKLVPNCLLPSPAAALLITPSSRVGAVQSMPPLKSFPLKSNLERALIRSANKSFEFQGSSSTFPGCPKFWFGADLRDQNRTQAENLIELICLGWTECSIYRADFDSSLGTWDTAMSALFQKAIPLRHRLSILRRHRSKWIAAMKCAPLKWECWSRLKSPNEWPSFEFVWKCVIRARWYLLRAVASGL